MRKITLFTLIFLGFWSVNAQQNRLMSKEQERAKLQTVRPLEHHYDHLRSPSATSFLSENFDGGAIPATWTVVDNTGNGAWNVVNDYSGNTLDGTPFAFINSDAAGSVDLDSELISPEVDASAAAALFVSFDQYFNAYTSNSTNETADVDVWDGTQWVNVYTTNADTGVWGDPDHQLIDVTAYKNAQFKVRFHYYLANYDWYWAVDNVKVFEPDADDLAAVNALPETFIPNAPFYLKGDVYNNGTNQQDTFDVTFNVKDATNTVVFTETVNVTGAALASGSTYSVTATTPTNLAAGTYTLEVSVALAGDADSSNDVYSMQLHIIDYASTYQLNTVYSYDAFDGDSSGDIDNLITFDIGTGAATASGALTTGDFLSSGTFINDVLVGVEYGTNNVYFIDGTGAAYKYGTFTGDIGTEAISAIAYDSALQQGFLTNGTVLLSFDQNLNTTVIGALNSAGLMIGIDVDNNGNMYGIDIVDDQLYSIDPTTGAATAIGPLGIDILYAQDMGVDPTTGNLYGTLYEVDNNTGGLYSIDKVTGAATAIGTPGQDEYTICAIKGTTAAISENTIEGLRVYPNPTNGAIIVNAKENIQNVSVVNLAGQEVLKLEANGLNTQFDLSNLPSGSYILKITTNKTTAAYQIIKK